MGFKVIIVGGSVAGLSVANMLEQFDIDYVLLEAYPQIAPQVGASIGILPNGFRILDQLGCFEPILDIAGDCRYTIGGMHGPDGLPLVASSPTSLSVHFEKRVGYPSIFIDRQMLLQVLYRNLKHKDRVLTKKRVSRVELVDGGVQAYTQDGSVYEGDIVVGADGIHSAVRDEMWRLGKEQSPGYFPKDENSPPGDRTYWFLFDGLSETKFGKAISKYTKADEEGLVKGHRDDHITRDVTFGELYDRKIMSTLVPLEEYVFDRWHYKRIITIGDSAHKIDPASGQGGNGAMESAALLVNALVRQLKLSPQGLSDSQIDSALSEVHALRYERAKRLVEQAHSLQMMISQRFPFARFIFKHLISLFGQDAFIDIVTPICCEATRIQGIPVPKRPHFVPFEDELPAKPIKGGLVRRVPWVLATGTLGLSLFAALKSKDLGAGTGVFYSTLQQWGAGGLLAKVAGESPAAGLVHLIPVLSTWLIEGSRRGNSIIPLSWTTVYSLIYSLIGPSSVLPFFCLSSVLFSTKSTINRPVDPKIAKSIVPGVLLGYVAPTVAALLPIRDAKLRHYVGKLWQAYPLLCAVFTRGLAAIRTKTNNSEQPESDTKVEDRPINYAPPSELQLYKNEDVAPLKFSHGFALALSLAVPVITRAISSPDWTLSAISQVAPFGPNTGIISAASGLAYSLYAVWELRSLGFVRTKQAVLGGLASLGFLGLAGPGAMIAGIEYWREHVISSLSPETELL
ncbi:FAD-dependent monooxygenase andE [Fusarium oxysporum f. sp. raphani]|uniref:FAD-dependent monooxygenase andE n=1 Tax=Fusarium oxysporum f. sp. raphani TaxID=96318 RepID=A0A8J5Q4G1_FUSOX|nr:FAD-dependent monooxygenase andE [Fusarium oxysporum f. sp. raphani]